MNMPIFGATICDGVAHLQYAALGWPTQQRLLLRVEDGKLLRQCIDSVAVHKQRELIYAASFDEMIAAVD